MKSRTLSSRRRFFFSAGAALSAPLAAGTAFAGGADDARADALDTVESIRRLEQALAARIVSGDADGIAKLFLDPERVASLDGVRRIAPTGFGERDVVELGADGESARIELPCELEIEAEIEAEGTLVEMARLQGDGLLRRRETRTLEAELAVAADGTWKFRRLEFR
jgi:hypothetical protein